MFKDELDGSDPKDWPQDVLDTLYGDNDLPCNICIVRPTCKRTYEQMCNDRVEYYKTKLEERI